MRSFLWIALLGLLTACVSPRTPVPTSGPVQATALPSATPFPTPTPRPLAQVTIQVRVPENTPIHQGIFLTLVDELTGLTIAPQRQAMQEVGPGTFRITMTLPFGTVLTYRYERKDPQGRFVQEVRANGEPVRYRMLQVAGSMEVTDTVARWSDTPYTGPAAGRLEGQVVDANTGEPVPDALVFVAGYQVPTDALGNFLVEPLPPGVHNVVVMDMRGRYRLFQQLAEIAPQAMTPARIPLQPATLVPVQFVVEPPAGTPPGAPLRLIGQYYTLGNTFGDLRGGLSVVASRGQQMQYDQGRYTLTLNLPAGEEFRYKFTLGDGLINAELDEYGNPRVRRLLVPDAPVRIVTRILRWNRPNTAPVWIRVQVPETTPVEDIISLQLAYNTWGEPLPLWYLGGQEWGYILYGPFPGSGTVRYRYCRNEQCEVAPEAGRFGQYGRGIIPSLSVQQLQDTVEAWANFQPETPLQLTAPQPTSRGPAFPLGLAWTPGYHPAWMAYEVRSLRETAQLGANVVVFQPSWHVVGQAPYPVWVQQPGADALAPDVLRWFEQARAAGLQPWLFPQLRYPQGAQTWWKDAPRDFPWWVAWFDRYRAFLLHFAALAARGQAAGLILGGQEGAWSFPEREIADGVLSQAPADAEQRWLALLGEIRQVYDGPVFWAVTDPDGLDIPPALAQAVDGFYLLWHPPAYTGRPDDAEALLAHMADDVAQRLTPWALEYQKPVWVAVGFPAAQGALEGCVRPASGDGCVPEDLLLPPEALTLARVDVDAQWRGLHAALQALDTADWVKGVVVRAWYPPVAAQEPSFSIRGKPAAQVVLYWFTGWRR